MLLHNGVPIAHVSKRLGPPGRLQIYQNAVPDTDQDVAATWDKLMAAKAEPKPVAQIGSVKRRDLKATDLVWRPFVDAYRTFLRNPGADGRRVLEQLASLPMSA